MPELSKSAPDASRLQRAGRRCGRIAIRLARGAVAGYLIVVLLAMWFENSLIFVPFKHPAGDWQPQGLVYDDANFASADGTRLHGWFAEAPAAKAVVLFCHGNAGNVTHRADLMRAMQQHVGASILVFDYRGFGRSAGSPSEAGVLQDARAARKWLAERANVPQGQIVLMGESLGGAVCVDLAARDGARGLVLEDTFTSLPDMAAYHYSWLPTRWLLRSRLDSLSLIGRYRGPLLMAHGDRDRIVPLAYGKRLFDAANDPKEFVVERGQDHNDARSKNFYAVLTRYLQELPPKEAQP